MKNHPKVSIIIPVYNGKEFMKEAIDSALNQTYKNIEIIVVNDGSNDNGATSKIAKSYGNKIRYFEKENGGVSTALNLALKNMEGDFFSWLSHDDRYYNNKIEEQIEYLKDFDKKTILYSDYDLMDENSTIFAKSIKNHDELMKKPEYSILRGAINGITLLIPKNAFKECGNFREDLRCTQDYELWARMIDKYKFVHQPKVLATTRIHKNQTGNTSSKMLSEGNELWVNLIEKYSNKDKIRLENTIYLFYYKMCEFMKTTPYNQTVEYLNEKLTKMENDFKKEALKIKVSVIIPYYNNPQEVKRAINSILNQTHQNQEILLIDDGSTKIVNKNIIKNKKIKNIKLKINGGVSNARNIGIEKSTGEYIAFLDSDDEFLPNKIANQLIYMLKTNSEFCYTSYYRKIANEIIPINCSSENEDLQTKCISNCNIATPTVMIKKSFITNNKINYDTKIQYGEDIKFYLEIFKLIKPTYYNEYLTNVYVDKESAFNNFNKQNEGLKIILKYLLNDEFYSKKDVEIAKVCYGYYQLIKPFPNEKGKLTKVKNNKIIKYIKILYKKGPIYCIIRLYHKIFD